MKLVKRTYRFRLYPNDSQKETVEKTLGCSRQIYNLLLSFCKSEYEKNQNFKINEFDLIKLIPKYKEEFPYLKEIDSIALQQSVKHLYLAYNNFFRHKSNYPVFKKKKNDYGYVTMNINNSVRILGDEIQIPKIGRVKFVYHRQIPKSFKFTCVSVTRKGKFYYIALQGEEEYEEYSDYQSKSLNLNNSIGLDFSLSSLFVGDNKTKSTAPKFYNKFLLRLSVEQRRLSHMIKGSNNYNCQLLRIRNLYEKISNQRRDYLHKLSRRMANTYDYVFAEDLDLQEMAHKKEKFKLGTYVTDAAYRTFLNQLEYKLKWLGKKLVRIDKYFPSSQLCSSCGFRNKDLLLKTKYWVCPKCGAKHNRDHNAATNIKNEGIRLVLKSSS